MVTKIIAKKFYWIAGFIAGIWGLVILILGIGIGFVFGEKFEEDKKRKPVSYNSYFRK